MKYINSNIIKAEVKEKLKIFFEANKVDDSLFYPVFNLCMSKFRHEVYPTKALVLEVRNKEAVLPSDFKSLACALACYSGETIELSDPFTINTYDAPTCTNNLSNSTCNVCTDDVGSMLNIYQKFSTHTVNWTNFDLLCPTKSTMPVCAEGCFNFKSKSENEIDIRNGKMYTSFKEGLVYIEYLADLESNSNFEFPYNATIIEWIKAECIHEIFQTLYYNGETDIERRYRDSKNDVAIKYTNAFRIINTTEYQESYKLANLLINRYNKVANLSNPSL